jgi:hypothetical protein
VPHSAAYMKANWSCTACGMYSGRRYCVQRHIDNPNIHKGKANAIPFVEYLVGRREGLYPPNVRPSYGSRKERTLKEKAEDELKNIFARRAAESYLPKVGNPVYIPLMKAVVNNIKARQSRPDWEKLSEIIYFSQMNIKPDVAAAQGPTSKGAVQDGILNNDVDLTECKKILENVSLNRRKKS